METQNLGGRQNKKEEKENTKEEYKIEETHNKK